jgi:hypothetical protein
MARKDNGTTLPILGTKGLRQIGRLFLATAAELITLAKQALAADNFDDADRMIEEALRRDPHDPESLAVRAEIAKQRAAKRPDAKAPAPAAATPAPEKPSATKPGVTKPSATKPDPAKPKKAAGTTGKPAPKTPAAKPAAGDSK